MLQRGDAKLQNYFDLFHKMYDFDEIFFANLLRKDAVSSFSIRCMDCMDVQSSGVNLEFTFGNVCGHFGRHYSRLQV